METNKNQLTDAELTALKEAIKEHYAKEQEKKRTDAVSITADDINTWAKKQKK